MSITITRQHLRSWGACYSDGRIAELVPPDGVSLLDVLDAESIPTHDRVWVAVRALPRRSVDIWRARMAARAMRAAGVEDIRAWRAVWVVMQYHHGRATREQVRLAADAAYASVIYDSADYYAAAYAAYAAAAYAYAHVDVFDTAVAAVASTSAARVIQLAELREIALRVEHSVVVHPAECATQLAELREIALRVES